MPFRAVTLSRHPPEWQLSPHTPGAKDCCTSPAVPNVGDVGGRTGSPMPQRVANVIGPAQPHLWSAPHEQPPRRVTLQPLVPDSSPLNGDGGGATCPLSDRTQRAAPAPRGSPRAPCLTWAWPPCQVCEHRALGAEGNGQGPPHSHFWVWNHRLYLVTQPRRGHGAGQSHGRQKMASQPVASAWLCTPGPLEAQPGLVARCDTSTGQTPGWPQPSHPAGSCVRTVGPPGATELLGQRG